MAMESLLAKALESKLKYWLKSYTRDQFKLKGRTLELCNLDLNGEILHASVGLPSTLLVSQARVGKLEIMVPPFSNVQVEPVVVQVDKLDIVLMEKSVSETDAQTSISTSPTAKSTSYGFADKIADGMTFQVGTVSLLLETRGGIKDQGASWTPPLAAITIHNLILYTTNEGWQVVNLKEARDFSNNKKCIYVFKMLEWESLSVDLLPHPDMFSDERLTGSKLGKDDDDGAKRLFFGGERFLEKISGKAYITMHRTEQNNPLGLEVQLQMPEVVCTALSEPGLRALLRFMTGMYVCMNRGDVDTRSQSGAETAGRSLVSVNVSHIFFRIKDVDFQLELLLQNLLYMRYTVIYGQQTKTMTRIHTGDIFLRDTFSNQCNNLLQPVKSSKCSEVLPVPNFASDKLWPRIYPLSDLASRDVVAPLLCMHSVQIVPSPAPPVLASQSVVQCQPLQVELHEESCLRLASLLADGISVERGVVTSTTSVDSMYFTLKQLDVVIPMNVNAFIDVDSDAFKGARLHVKDFVFIQSPSLNLRTLELEKDPACFMLWQGQPIDASQRKWVMRAMKLYVALEMCSVDVTSGQFEQKSLSSLWNCVEMTEPCIEMAMVTGDGDPIVTVPPPGGIVRFGLQCKKLTSNTSVEQLFFVLKMYEYLGKVNESVAKVTKLSKNMKSVSRIPSASSFTSMSNILEMAPSDTAIRLGLVGLELKFLESISGHKGVQGPPLVQVTGSDICLKVTHRTLGGAVAIISKLTWEDALVECVEARKFSLSSSEPASMQENLMRPVFWISNGKYESSCTENSNEKPLFLDIEVTNVIPYRLEDEEYHSLRVSAKISGVRLGGGMLYSEALLHRFGVLGPDGGPGKGLKTVLRNLSNGPLATLLKPPSQAVKGDQQLELPIPDEVQISIQLRDCIFALEADLQTTENALMRREKCWHSAFQCLSLTARGGHENQKKNLDSKRPVQEIILSVDGLEFIKPVAAVNNKYISSVDISSEEIGRSGSQLQTGLDIEVSFAVNEKIACSDMAEGQWTVTKLRSGIKNPVHVEATKEEVEYLIETVRLEMESAARITAGLMQLFQAFIGDATIKQLSSIGSDSLDRFITPDKVGRRSSIDSINSAQFCNGNIQEECNQDSNLYRLEQAIATSQEICAKLSNKLKNAGEDLTQELSLLACQLKNMEDFVKTHQ